jgi:hypothetical protein
VRGGVIAGVLATVAMWGVGCGAGTSARESAPAVQVCVFRWNWTHVTGETGGDASQLAAAMVTNRPCHVDIQYERGSAFQISCKANRFGVFDCSEHGLGPPEVAAFKRHNARYDPRTGVLRLDHPASGVRSPKKPDWLLRYPIDDGFIVPFDDRGQLRPGLALRTYDNRPLVCVSIKPMPYSKAVVNCGAGLYCFAARAQAREREKAACTFWNARGSRVFYRGILRWVT